MHRVELLLALQRLCAQDTAEPLQEDQVAALAEHGHRERGDERHRVESDQFGGARPRLDRPKRACSSHHAQRLAQSYLLVRCSL